MDDNLITFLNNFPLGTSLAILFAGGALILSGVAAFKKYKESLKVQILAEEENSSYKKSINELKGSISNLETKIEEYVEHQEEQRNEIHTKLDKLSEALEEEHQQSTEADERLQNFIQTNAEKVNDMSIKLDKVNKKTNLLIDSDKEGIKATITDKYYQALRDKYIEIHVLQSLESLYEKYLEEHGNTFIGGLMKELRTLPHTPPEDNE